jgi:hypothetical protein
MREQTAMRRECASIGAIPCERPVIYWHNLQPYYCKVEVERIPRTECSTLATRGITKGQLGARRVERPIGCGFKPSISTVNLSALKGTANYGSNSGLFPWPGGACRASLVRRAYCYLHLTEQTAQQGMLSHCYKISHERS